MAKFELDHIFVWTEVGGPEADRLIRFGLTEGTPTDPTALLQPRGSHRIPDRYAPTDLLVRAR